MIVGSSVNVVSVGWKYKSKPSSTPLEAFQNPVKHFRWRFLQKYLTVESY